jgi:hypothetical protein
MTRHVHKSTFFSHTHPDEGGRFAVSDQPPRHVVGSTSVPQYFARSNWSTDPTGVEPPLGVRIDEMVPVGEAHEISASLGEAHSDDVGCLLPKVLDSASPDEEQRSDAGSPFTVSSEVAPSSPPQSKRKSRRKG